MKNLLQQLFYIYCNIGIATNRSIRSIRSMRGSESSDFMIGGNESGSGSLVDITSMHHLHLDSTQTSPTKTHITAPQLYTTPSKTRHLNDRLDPRKSREYYEDQGEEEPYAWISQTAPSRYTSRAIAYIRIRNCKFIIPLDF